MFNEISWALAGAPEGLCLHSLNFIYKYLLGFLVIIHRLWLVPGTKVHCLGAITFWKSILPFSGTFSNVWVYGYLVNGQYFELVTARDLINYWPSLPIYTWISTFPKMSTHIILCFDPAFEVSKVKTFICFLEHEERRLNKLWIISKPLKYQTRIDSPLRWKPMPQVFIIQASKKSFRSLIAMLKIL